MKSVTVIDYGLGNLFNLVTALRVVGAEVEVTDDPTKIVASDRVILPGVGAFGPGMDTLRSKALEPAICQFKDSGRPLLGICLGMQFLMTESEENGIHRGLDFISGRVLKFDSESNGKAICKVPQMSWNSLLENKQSSTLWDKSILRNLSVGTNMYFVHSYYVKTTSAGDTTAYAEYGNQQYSAVIGHENVFGVQFHPERSATDGLTLIKNFLDL